MSLDTTLTILLAALVIEAACGYPAALQSTIRHPVQWIGALIAALDAALNRATLPDPVRRLNGVAALVVILAAAVVPSLLIQFFIIEALPYAAALLLLALASSSLLAQRSLYRHVADVAAGLESVGLAGGRAAVARIVGRNPETLDEAGVARAAIESLAENFSDGVVAPAFWGGLFGLPGFAGYKAANTADSMIGHRTPRHLAFGWAAARFDDLINLPASRLAALWLMLAALFHGSARGALRAVARDSTKHRSPNAGWPEAAMAGALGLRLAGPRTYGDVRVDDAWMGDGRSDATAADIRRALAVYRTACIIQIVAVALVAALIARG